MGQAGPPAGARKCAEVCGSAHPVPPLGRCPGGSPHPHSARKCAKVCAVCARNVPVTGDGCQAMSAHFLAATFFLPTLHA